MRRMTEPLNASLAAIELLHLDSAADRPREYWQERASREVLGVLNLVNAWHALVRFKLGELLPQQHIRPFNAQDMLDWLSVQLELSSPLRIKTDIMLESSKEALQEALLMLYSAAYTLGPNVHLVVKRVSNGVWFRIRYARVGKNQCPDGLAHLMDALRGNWRLEDTAFELRLADDFITLSGSKLHFQGTEQFCELAFFVYGVGKRPAEPLNSVEVNAPPTVSESPEEDFPLIVSQDAEPKDLDTQKFSEEELAEMVDQTLEQVFGETAGITPLESPAAANPSDSAMEGDPSSSPHAESGPSDDTAGSDNLTIIPPDPLAP